MASWYRPSRGFCELAGEFPVRLADNPALAAGLETCERVIPVYVFAPQEAGAWKPGAAANWWLHHGLDALSLTQKAGNRESS
ncbi:MAG: deoxyribodipyrimidine photo-lyase [Pseudomonadota bacterium]|nr:deoxyribodipyrimidine photo-lyase [Pseudomonadota bacterium]